MSKKNKDKYATDKILNDINKRMDYLPLLAYCDTSEETYDLIMYVISFMPEELVSFVTNKIMFFDSHGDKGKPDRVAYCYHTKSQIPEFTVYFDSTFSSHSKKFRCYVIAHEIGHAYLGHYELGREISEKEADEFAAEHGFADPKENLLKFRALVGLDWKEFNWFEKVLLLLFSLIMFSLVIGVIVSALKI